MDLSDYLVSAQLLDCTGRITHTFTLLPDGMVEVVMGSTTVVVNPTTRLVVRPRGATVSNEVFQRAETLAREALG